MQFHKHVSKTCETERTVAKPYLQPQTLNVMPRDTSQLSMFVKP